MTSNGEAVGGAPLKRSHDQLEESATGNGSKTAATAAKAEVDADDSSSDDGFGPALPSDAAPPKKKRKLPYEKLYISALPASPRYTKSLMHKDQLSFVTVTPTTDFLITSSLDGVVKFWKKVPGGAVVEAVKEFKAHVGEIRSVSVSADGRSFATAGVDRTIKIFDVVSFDLLAIVQIEGDMGAPRTICWVHRRGASMPLLAVSMDTDPRIRIYDGRGEMMSTTQGGGGGGVVLHTIEDLHKSPVCAIAYNDVYDCAVSADESGMIEYWDPGTYEKPEQVFAFKSSTNLFEFRKAKCRPTTITMAPSGKQFATFSFPDRKVRVFDFLSGKLYRTYDESIATISEMQQAGTALQTLEASEFARRLAVEREIDSTTSHHSKINVIFDESSNFILYGSILGTKVLNTLTNRVVKLYGATEPFRSLNLAIYQGIPGRKALTTVAMAASTNPLLQEAEERDPMLVTTGAGKVRFYMFTNESDVSKSSRDVQNERPQGAPPKPVEEKKIETGTQATMHTTMGDIQLRLFPDAAPKAVENFVTHARNGYYNSTLFHRVIKKFMIQGGDPLGDGTGGESIWGREFEDEFSTLKHDKPYTLSMANAGPNTNGSQFFITTERAPWLDRKHTIFGRAVGGLDVVKRIEGVRVRKERPEEDVSVVSIDVV